jgi:hypothetical protein
MSKPTTREVADEGESSVFRLMILGMIDQSLSVYTVSKSNSAHICALESGRTHLIHAETPEPRCPVIQSRPLPAISTAPVRRDLGRKSDGVCDGIVLPCIDEDVGADVGGDGECVRGAGGVGEGVLEGLLLELRGNERGTEAYQEEGSSVQC